MYKIIPLRSLQSLLRGVKNNTNYILLSRLQMLLFIKKDTTGFVSKRNLSVSLGVNHTSIKELLEWTTTELSQDFKYITLLKYTQRHFGCKIKTARKSHIKKEDEAVSIFKKHLVTSAKK